MKELDDGELLIVIASDSPQAMIADYGKRWGVETLFCFLKTREFCLESTHFKDKEPPSKLIALMKFALCWAIKTGKWLTRLQPLAVRQKTRSQSQKYLSLWS